MKVAGYTIKKNNHLWIIQDNNTHSLPRNINNSKYTIKTRMKLLYMHPVEQLQGFVMNLFPSYMYGIMTLNSNLLLFTFDVLVAIY